MLDHILAHCTRLADEDRYLCPGETLRRLLVENELLRRKTFAPSSVELALAIGVADAAVDADRESDLKDQLDQREKEAARNGDEKEQRRVQEVREGNEWRLHLAVDAYWRERQRRLEAP